MWHLGSQADPGSAGHGPKPAASPPSLVRGSGPWRAWVMVNFSLLEPMPLSQFIPPSPSPIVSTSVLWVYSSGTQGGWCLPEGLTVSWGFLIPGL